MFRFVLAAAACLVAASAARAQEAPAKPAEAPALEWKNFQPFFAPPEQYKGRLGGFRSVMKFDDGTEMKSPADWPRRRAEILKYWHSVMGEWPALVEKPRVEFLAKEHVENFTRHKVRVETAAGVMQDAWLLVPDGPGPFPAVLVTWYGIDDSAGVKNLGKTTVAFGYDLAKRGFVTLSIGGPPGGPRAVQPSGIPSEGPKTIQPLSWMAYVAANCAGALASLPDVDPKRIGVVGHSYGGKWAMFASCLSERFAAAAWIDPGIVWNENDANANYWEPWYLGLDPALAGQRKPGVPSDINPRTGAYKRLVAEGRDLHELHALMAPRPFLVSGGEQDKLSHWVPLNHAIALYKFLGFDERVAMTQRGGHTPTARSNAQVYAFFEHFLK